MRRQGGQDHLLNAAVDVAASRLESAGARRGFLDLSFRHNCTPFRSLHLWSRRALTSRTPTKERLPVGVTGGTRTFPSLPVSHDGARIASSDIGWTYRKIHACERGRLRRRSGAHQPETPQNPSIRRVFSTLTADGS